MNETLERVPLTCSATNRSGGACLMPVLNGERFCWNHSPTVAAERAAARRRGGATRVARESATGELPSLKSVADVRRELEQALADTKMLGNSARRATAVVSVLTLALKAIESGEWETRLANVEKILGEQNVARASLRVS